MALGKLPEDEPRARAAAIFAEINITPLTDIFLVLLIIFMVTTDRHRRGRPGRGRQGEPAQGRHQGDRPGRQALVVSVLQTASVLVQGPKVRGRRAEEPVPSAFAKDPSTQVIIEADEGVTHGRVVGS